jgi:DsbC/DsbD-like thiol-disulfide interchange protein
LYTDVVRLAVLLFVASTFTAANLHIAVKGTTTVETVGPGSKVTIAFDITPARRMHVYAPGADYKVIAITMDPQPGITAAKLVYPPSETYYFEPLDERVPVYQKPFTLKQDLTIGEEALTGKDTLTLSGRIEYQACDDKVCFKPNAVPFKFELEVKASPGM